jgi:hypothetical protein
MAQKISLGNINNNTISVDNKFIDGNPTIWRYMDFTKFVYMLENQSLYFCRSDRLGDKFEGSYPNQNLEKLKKEHGQDVIESTKEYNDLVGKNIYINCWHINNKESLAMWKVYLKSNEGVAIKTSVKKFCTALLKNTNNIDMYANKVTYIDYLTENLWTEEQFAGPYFYKRNLFDYEQEFRAIISNMDNLQSMSINGGPHTWYLDTSIKSWKEGMEINVPIQEMIEEIFVAPDSPEWFKKLVENVAVKYNLPNKVKRSALEDEKIL